MVALHCQHCIHMQHMHPGHTHTFRQACCCSPLGTANQQLTCLCCFKLTANVIALANTGCCWAERAALECRCPQHLDSTTNHHSSREAQHHSKLCATHARTRYAHQMIGKQTGQEAARQRLTTVKRPPLTPPALTLRRSDWPPPELHRWAPALHMVPE